MNIVRKDGDRYVLWIHLTRTRREFDTPQAVVDYTVENKINPVHWRIGDGARRHTRSILA